MDLNFTDSDCLFWIGEDLFAENHIEKMIEVWGALNPSVDYIKWRGEGGQCAQVWATDNSRLMPIHGLSYTKRRETYSAFVRGGGGLSPVCLCYYMSEQFWGDELVLTPAELDAISHAGYKVMVNARSIIVSWKSASVESILFVGC